MRFRTRLFPTKAMLLYIASICSTAMEAQSSCVIIDKETGTPIRDVKAHTDKGDEYATDYQGHLTIDQPFESATLVHGSYLSRKMKREEICDTIWLLPNAIRLDEVVVWGQKNNALNTMMSLAMAQAAATATPPAGGIHFDFFSMLKKKPLSKKARKKNKELLRDWDKVYGTP